VRRYAENGFVKVLSSEGFVVRKVGVGDLFEDSVIERFGFDREAIYFARKPG
jgi:hypothetical protein